MFPVVSQSIGFNSDSLRLPNKWQRDIFCKPSRMAESLSGAELDDLIAYAEMRKIPQIGGLSYPGRSLYTDNYKIKGAYGLRVNSERQFELQAPQPNIEYGRQLPHMTLSVDMEVGVRYSTKRGLYSLSAHGADTEFECMLRMCKSGFAFMPLLSVHNMLTNGQPELSFCQENGEGRATGVFFQRTKVGLKFLGEVTSFHLVGDDICRKGPEEIYCGYPKLASYKPDYLEDLIKQYCDFAEKLGEIRRVSVENGILRHVAHLGNFLFEPDTKAIYMADTDSCLIAGLSPELSIEALGPQLVRDLCNDTVRMITALAQDAYSAPYLDYINKSYQPELDPAFRFLKGFVGDRISVDTLREQCEFLNSMYKNFLLQSRMMLNLMAQKRADAFLAEDIATQKKMESLWSLSYEELRKFALYVTYNLVADLKDSQFKLKSVNQDKLIKNFVSGVDLVMGEYSKIFLSPGGES